MLSYKIIAQVAQSYNEGNSLAKEAGAGRGVYR